MSIEEDIKLASLRIKAAGFTLSDWLKKAGIPRANWYRWGAGGDLGVRRWEEIKERIALLPDIVERRAPGAGNPGEDESCSAESDTSAS